MHTNDEICGGVLYCNLTGIRDGKGNVPLLLVLLHSFILWRVTNAKARAKTRGNTTWDQKSLFDGES
jgi:hypothetical protein